MAASPQLSMIQYLNTTYDPDLEYVDGRLVERNVGKWEHARVQALLAIWFGQHETEWSIQTATELRTRVAWTRVRLPDVLLVSLEPQPDIITAPPILAIEILSEGDSYQETQIKCADYVQMGSKAVWIINPMDRTARFWNGSSWVEATRLEVSGTPIHLELQYLWDRLNPARG
jgi:Uma2 family endonuclease